MATHTQSAALTTKQLVERWFDTLWNKKDGKQLEQLMDSAAVGMSEGGEVKGPAEFRSKMYTPLLQAFPDFSVKLDGIVSEGNEAAVRWTATATHSGPFFHLPASKKRVSFSGITWMEFKNGKLIHGSDSYNAHGLVALLSGGAPSATVRSL